MIKKLQHFPRKPKNENILFSEKSELDQFLIYNIVFAVQDDIVYFIIKDSDYYKVIDFNCRFKEAIYFERLIREYNLATLDPADVVSIIKKV